MTKKSIPMLLDEPPITVYPSLAKELGNVNKAIILQQLHFLLNITQIADNQYNLIDDKWWVYNSYEQWHKYFSWLSVSTIKGLFGILEHDGLILSRQGVKDKWDRRKWYTIDYDAFNNLVQCMGQKLSDVHETKTVPSEGQKLSDESSEITSETTPENKSANAQPSTSNTATVTFPKSLKSYTAEHVLAYQSLHATDMTALVHAWQGDMYNSITEFATKIGRMYIEVHQELSRLQKPNTDYLVLANYTKKKDAWKDSHLVTDMLLYVTEYNHKPTQPTSWDDIPELRGITEIIR